LKLGTFCWNATDVDVPVTTLLWRRSATQNWVICVLYVSGRARGTHQRSVARVKIGRTPCRVHDHHHTVRIQYSLRVRCDRTLGHTPVVVLACAQVESPSAALLSETPRWSVEDTRSMRDTGLALAKDVRSRVSYRIPFTRTKQHRKKKLCTARSAEFAIVV
jgi:hypothetical protein